MNQLACYERWALGIELALALNVAIVVALLAYLFCKRSADSGCGGSRVDSERGDYRHLISFNPHNKSPNNLNIEYRDQERQEASISDEDDDWLKGKQIPSLNQLSSYFFLSFFFSFIHYV